MARFRPTQDTPFTAPVDELWRVNSGSEALHIRDLPTRRRRGFTGKKKAGQAALSQRAEVLAELQERMWAHVKAAPEDQRQALVERIAARTTEDSPAQKRRRTILMGKQTAQALNALERGPRILLVLQGMDASGKGGVVSSVVSAMDPLGVDVAAFGAPTPEEQQQHYLQRIIEALPEPGHVGVFDRSHYEDVLVPAISESVDDQELARRVETLQVFEQQLVRTGFVIIKVMLNVSPKEQLSRLLSRLDRADKHWKYHPSDADARERFRDFLTVYSGLLEATDADWAPWHVIAADRKWYSRLAVQELLIAALADLELGWPAASYDVDRERRRLLESISD